MLPIIVRERLNQRIRVLRLRWHDEGDTLLKSGKYLDFADGLLRLMRQLDAIGAAIAHLPQPSQFSYLAEPITATKAANRGTGTRRPRRGPTDSLA